MIDHSVKHQKKLIPQPLNVLPISQVRVDLFVVNNGKSIIRRIREKRKDVYYGHKTSQLGIEEISQCF